MPSVYESSDLSPQELQRLADFRFPDKVSIQVLKTLSPNNILDVGAGPNPNLAF